MKTNNNQQIEPTTENLKAIKDITFKAIKNQKTRTKQ